MSIHRITYLINLFIHFVFSLSIPPFAYPSQFPTRPLICLLLFPPPLFLLVFLALWGLTVRVPKASNSFVYKYVVLDSNRQVTQNNLDKA